MVLILTAKRTHATAINVSNEKYSLCKKAHSQVPWMRILICDEVFRNVCTQLQNQASFERDPSRSSSHLVEARSGQSIKHPEKSLLSYSCCTFISHETDGLQNVTRRDVR